MPHYQSDRDGFLDRMGKIAIQSDWSGQAVPAPANKGGAMRKIPGPLVSVSVVALFAGGWQFFC